MNGTKNWKLVITVVYGSLVGIELNVIGLHKKRKDRSKYQDGLKVLCDRVQVSKK